MPLSFDLVVATVDRADALRTLLASLGRQTYPNFRVLLVEQSNGSRVEPPSGVQVERFRSERGLSRARNAALPHVAADLVAFPDDDCVYPDDLLARVARRFERETTLDGLTGRDQGARWPDDAATLTRDNVWNRAISFTIFLRAGLVARVGGFDERLGLPSSSAEEIDFLIRALDAGARIEYDPTIVVTHEPTARALDQLGTRDGESIGYILRKHRYPRSRVARMFFRPAAGALLATIRNDRTRARFHAATFRGRIGGYRRA